MVQWVYKFDWISYKSHPELINQLNQLGRHGWEMVYFWEGGATALNECHAFTILKKPKATRGKKEGQSK